MLPRIRNAVVVCTTSDGPGFQKSGFGFWKWPCVMGRTQIKQGLWPFFCHFWCFFKVEHTEVAAYNFEKSSKMAKIWQKLRNALFNLHSSTHFSHWFQVVKARFQRPGPSLVNSLYYETYVLRMSNLDDIFNFL